MKRLLILLSLLLVLCLLLCACVDRDDATDTAKLPELNGESGTASNPGEQTGPANPAGTAQPAPADSESPADPEGTAEPAAPEGSESMDQPPVESTEGDGFEGMEVVDEYTVVVSENIGVGGN